MSGPNNANTLPFIGAHDDPSDDPLIEMILDLVKTAVAIMMRSGEDGMLVETAALQVLLTTDFCWCKTEKGRGIKFDVLVETEGGRVIVAEFIVPCEEALYTGCSVPVSLAQ
jgi:hypothetical protein